MLGGYTAQPQANSQKHPSLTVYSNQKRENIFPAPTAGDSKTATHVSSFQAPGDLFSAQGQPASCSRFYVGAVLWSHPSCKGRSLLPKQMLMVPGELLSWQLPPMLGEVCFLEPEKEKSTLKLPPNTQSDTDT